MNNKIEKIASKTVDVSKTIEQKSNKTIQAGTEKYFLTCINNLPEESISVITPFGRNTAKQIPILVTDQSTNTNHTRMQHILLLDITIGSKYLAIVSLRLVNKLVTEANQASASFDIQGHGYLYFPFGS